MSECVKDALIFAQHIIIALDCLEEARAMQSIFSQEKYESQYKIAPHFYSTAYHAMLFQCQMEIAKLFDEGGHGAPYTFDRFKNKLCKSNEIGPSYIENYKLKKRIADKDLQAIKSRRNGYLAHSDEKYFDKPQILFSNEPVNSEAIKSLLLAMLTICNRVIFNSADYGPVHLYSTYNGDDFVKIFGCKTWYEQDAENYLDAKKR